MSRELHIVGFKVGRETYGVPITSLHEIVRVPEITAVPDAPDYLEGVINLRGKIVSVLDLRKRFGEKEATLRKQNRILVVEHAGRLAGLIVDSASAVRATLFFVLLEGPSDNYTNPEGCVWPAPVRHPVPAPQRFSELPQPDRPHPGCRVPDHQISAPRA